MFLFSLGVAVRLNSENGLFETATSFHIYMIHDEIKKNIPA